jgi:transcription elongation factor GreA
MVEKIPMTPGGLVTLEDELRNLKQVERPAVIRAIAEAREHGDLSENAEYHAARERQSFIEGRITELEDVISRAHVIDVTLLTGSTVRFGAYVTLADEDNDDESIYQIVGQHEADISAGRLSVHSPLARALIGKSVGDSVEVSSPGGSRSYEVVNVRFG